ncbi:bacillithiol biosynthesis cysteine-adding enzyme BshC [Leadbetterella byssophila]|uniref:bacillithiol biosynthesis cysteine-adding enzyme BshC n=1 Tax=Leadbetterella byssophila TaxID=316068 RepID=UPI0039A17B63
MQSHIQKLPLEQVANFPKIFLDYLNEKPELKPLYGHFPRIENFDSLIQEKGFAHRAVLVKVLEEQYAKLGVPENVKLLGEDNTYSVTTGHQLNIFTGPLYVIYKIVSTINLAKRLSEAYPDKNFVPVYWMATEDHDFEEIASFFLFGNKYSWTTTQKGAVGEMSLDGIQEVIDQLKDKPEIFIKAYSQNDNLADAVRQYMHELFGEHGLVCVDGNHRDFKEIFKPVIKEELSSGIVKQKLDENAVLLDQLGYKPQIHPREINLFYKDKGLRERIDLVEGEYKVLETALSFTKEEIEVLLQEHPERFSPNVALRPLYQEMILPNVAYLGGPSELTYWLQLKGIFDHFKVAFPAVMPRNLALVVNENLQKRLDKLGVKVEDLYQDDAKLRKAYVDQVSENQLQLQEEQASLDELFDSIIRKAISVDPTLKGAIEAEKVKMSKGISNLEARIKKAEERKFETSIQQLMGVKEKLFPGGSQQERKDNFLNFYLNNPGFLDLLFETFDPLDYRFNVLYL